MGATRRFYEPADADLPSEHDWSTEKYLAHQFDNGGEWLGVSVCRKARCQPFCSLCGNGNMLAGYRKCIARAFVVARNMQFQATHHNVSVQWGLDVLEVQQQPQLKTGHRRNRLKDNGLLDVVLKLAIQGRSQIQCIEIAAMVIAVKYGIDPLERAPLDVLVAVAIFE